MTQLIKKEIQKCIQLYDGGEIWVSEELANNIARDMADKDKVIKINNQIFRISQIHGIKDEEYMQELWYKKNGYTKCDYGSYHKKGEICNCYYLQREKENELYKSVILTEIVEECGSVMDENFKDKLFALKEEDKRIMFLKLNIKSIEKNIDKIKLTFKDDIRKINIGLI